MQHNYNCFLPTSNPQHHRKTYKKNLIAFPEVIPNWFCNWVIITLSCYFPNPNIKMTEAYAEGCRLTKFVFLSIGDFSLLPIYTIKSKMDETMKILDVPQNMVLWNFRKHMFYLISGNVTRLSDLAEVPPKSRENFSTFKGPREENHSRAEGREGRHRLLADTRYDKAAVGFFLPQSPQLWRW